MKRLTTDTPKDNLETALNLFFIKDRDTWVRRYGPPPECPDISLDNLMRELIAKFLPDVKCPQDPADFSFMMAEWLYDDVDTAEGALALLYSAAWAFAELRERLKKYENLGLDLDSFRPLQAPEPGSRAALASGIRQLEDTIQVLKEMLKNEECFREAAEF